MPCDYDQMRREAYRRVDEVAMAEQGLSPEQIADLKARQELARETAKAKSWASGDTLETQQRKIAAAVEKAIDEWHQDIHAELAHGMDSIRFLGKLMHETGMVKKG